MRFAAGAAVVVAVGGALQAVGIDPTWPMVGICSGAVGLDIRTGSRYRREAEGREYWERVGETVGWPIVFSSSFFGAGAVLEPHHSVSVDWNSDPGGSARLVAQAGIQSGVLAFDAPALVTTALDHSRDSHAEFEDLGAAAADGAPQPA